MTKLFTPIGWALIAVAALATAFLLWVILVRPAEMAREAVRASAQATIASGQLQAAGDAARAADAASRAAAEEEKMTTENSHAILAAPGADVGLDPRLNRAALERVCQRAAYARSADCLRLAHRP